jgi:DNA-binding NarL/FixJ family response regulator
MTKLRIFLACADQRLRVALLLLLDEEPGMAVVGITDSLPELLPLVKTTQPDALLLEWELPNETLAGLLTDFRNTGGPLKIVFLSNNPEDEERVTSAGADCFILKNAPPDTLLPILREYRTSLTELSQENKEEALHSKNQF